MSVPVLSPVPSVYKFLNKPCFNLAEGGKDLPPHLKKNIPNASKDFLNWLAGFTDAEGLFLINPDNRGTSLSVVFKFSIELHVDDIEVLHKIAQTLGVGSVKLVKGRNSAIFSVYKLDDLVRVIIPVFQEFPLQTTKYLDFTCFSKAVLIKWNSETRGKGMLRALKIISREDMVKIRTLKTRMNSGRLTINKKQIALLINNISINKWWLLGFVEGEGTFGYKHLSPYFQIAQHEKNLFVLKAIETYLLNLFEQDPDRVGSCFAKEFGVKYALNTRTGVYSMTVTKIDILFSYILPYFESMSFFSRKALDYQYWVISIVIHKYGYYYLPEGKKLALQISSATNKYRYTTSKVNNAELPLHDDISKLLAQPPLFDITNGSSHIDLVRGFTISKGGRNGFTVYVYDIESCKVGGEKELRQPLKGSPFSTYAAGHVAIGLKPGSRAIGRYIDTGRAFKGRYIFSSVPITS